MPWVLLQQLVTATGLWLNISTQKGPLTVIKTNVFALLLQGSNTRHTRTHTGAVTPNLDTEREGRKKIKGRQKARGWEGLAPYIPHKRPLPPSTCYHRGCSERKNPPHIHWPPTPPPFLFHLLILPQHPCSPSHWQQNTMKKKGRSLIRREKLDCLIILT